MYYTIIMWVDVGCPDFWAAARNREMVKHRRNIIGYLMVEAVLKGWPMLKRLPDWMPRGTLPKIGGDVDLGQRGMHII